MAESVKDVLERLLPTKELRSATGAKLGSQSKLWNYINGTRKPRGQQLVSLLAALGLDDRSPDGEALIRAAALDGAEPDDQPETPAAA